MSGAVVAAMAPLPPAVWARGTDAELPYPLGEPGCRLFSRGRHALFQALAEAGLEPGAEILAPAFHHGSEVEACVRAGITCCFYEATDSLAPDETELERLVTPRTRALHLIHYLGFPQDAVRWRRWCDERGLLLIEDAAQAWLATAGGRPVGVAGDIAVFCLYKTFGLPDGAALVSRLPGNGMLPPRRLGLLSLGLEHGLWLATRTRAAAWLADQRHPRSGSVEDAVALGRVGRPSLATTAVLPRAVGAGAAAARRRNYRRYLELLPGLAPSPFAELPDGASPFVYPVAVGDKRRTLHLLRQRRIRALDFWAWPHRLLPAERFPYARKLRATVIGLPVHQELREGDVDRVAAELQATLAA